MEVGEFHHVAWVFDSKKQQIWIDGKKNVEVRGGAELDGSGGMYVGHAQDPKSGRQTSGLGAVIEELRIYKKPLSELTDEEVARAGFESREELIQTAIELRLWPECFLWEIELLRGAGGAKRPSRPRP